MTIRQSPPTIRVGDTLWRFDVNRRRYTKAAKGRVYGELIYSEHFEAGTVVGESSRSWLVILAKGMGHIKVNKVSLVSSGAWSGQWFTDQGKADNIWANEHRHQIVRCVEQAPVTVLRAIAQTVGYAGAR